MKKIFLRICAVVTAAAVQPLAFALSDYENIYDYNLKDDVFRFDVGEFAEGTEEEITGLSETVRITNGIGLTEITDEKAVVPAEEYKKITARLMISADRGDNDKITVREVLGDMARLLDFDKMYEGDSAETAKKEGLAEGTASGDGAYITGRDLSVILWNALNSRYVKTGTNGADIELSLSDKSYMEEKQNIFKVSGLLDGAYKKSILSANAPGEGFVTIARAEYKSGGSGAEEWFGRRVTAYAWYDGYEYIIKYIGGEKGSESISFDLKDIYSIGDGYVYYDEDGKDKKVSLARIKYLNVNGDPKNIDEIEQYLKKSGSALFSSTQKGAVPDICALEVKEHFSVNTASSYDDRIVLKKGMSFRGADYIDTKAAEQCVITKNGEPITIDEINYNDSITVTANTDSSAVEITVSDAKVVGSVESIEDDVTYIEGKGYTQAEEFVSAEGGVDVKDSGTFYISADGYILGFKASDAYVYGYLKKAYYDEDSEVCIADIFGEDGKWQTYTFKENITVDAKKTAAPDAMADIAGDSIVRFKANNKNVISEMDTLAEGDNETDENRLRKAYEGNVKQSWKGGVWFRTDMGYRFSDSAVIFEIPDKKELRDEYKVRSSGYFKNDEQYINIVMYSPNELGFCSAGLIESQIETLSSDTKYWLYIERVSEGIDQDDEEIKILKGTRLTATGAVNVEPDYEYKITDTVAQKLEAITPGAFRPGTLMYLSVDSEGYIQNAQVEFTDSAPTVGYDTQGYVYQYFCGKVTAVDPAQNGNGSAFRGYFKVDTGKSQYVLSAQNLILIDSEKHEARKISCSDIIVGDTMYVARAFGEGRVCAVVR